MIKISCLYSILASQNHGADARRYYPSKLTISGGFIRMYTMYTRGVRKPRHRDQITPQLQLCPRVSHGWAGYLSENMSGFKDQRLSSECKTYVYLGSTATSR